MSISLVYATVAGAYQGVTMTTGLVVTDGTFDVVDAAKAISHACGMDVGTIDADTLEDIERTDGILAATIGNGRPATIVVADADRASDETLTRLGRGLAAHRQDGAPLAILLAVERTGDEERIARAVSIGLSRDWRRVNHAGRLEANMRAIAAITSTGAPRA